MKNFIILFLFTLLNIIILLPQNKVVNIDCQKIIGQPKPLLSVNVGPDNSILGYQDCGIKQIRTHDYYGPCDYWTYTINALDTLNKTINPNFNPNIPSSYRWKSTDDKIDSIVNFGFTPFFRLGISWPNSSIVPRFPPIDPSRQTFSIFASICRHTVMHYTAGWNNGRNYSIPYWEIWNEPDLADKFWFGPYANPFNFYKMYKEVADSIKSLNSSLKVGGPGVSFATMAFSDRKYRENFIEFCRDNSVPLDFYSWHLYDVKNPYSIVAYGDTIRNILDKNGFTNTESIITEIHPDLKGTEYNDTPKGAVWLISAFIACNFSKVDNFFWYRGTLLGALVNPDRNNFPNLKWNGLAYKAYSNFLKSAHYLIEHNGDEKVTTNFTSDVNCFLTIAGKTLNNDTIVVLVSNLNSSNTSITISIDNVPWNGNTKVEQYSIRLPNDRFSLESSNTSSNNNKLSFTITNASSPSAFLLKIYKHEIIDTNRKPLLEPEDGKVYHGACLMTYESTGDPIGPYLAALNDSTIQPAVRSFFITIPGERGPDNSFKGLTAFFHSADSIGFIPEVSLFFMDKNGSTDSVIAVSSQYDWIIDSIITLTKNYGKSSFLRIGGEFNGVGPGWNGGGYHPYLYVTMFRKIAEMYKAKGLRDSIAIVWCYEPDAPNDFDSVDSKGARWYPGDDYVDWFGLDVFDTTHFDQSLPDYDRRGITKKGKAERFLGMAREKRKPVYLNETSAKGINITSNLTDGMNDWNSWFAKFFDFIDKHKEIKGFNYINAKWPQSAYPGWGDARIQNNSYITQKYREEMKNSKYIHLPVKYTPTIDTIPLTELGIMKWKGYEGGLYLQGSNIRPPEHDSAGIEVAKRIVPLDQNGEVDFKNGKILFLSIGMSNTTQEFSKFKQIADTFQLKNPKVIIIDGAQGGQTAAIISNPNANFWNVVSQRLQSQGLTEKQVQVVWLKEADANPNQEFPVHAQILKNELKSIVQILKHKYPNIKIAYLSSRTYGGYAKTNLNPEPFAYESGFSVKWLIEEQINGDSSLAFDGTNPKVPFLSWGPYLWAKGTTPRQDGLIWLPEDFASDGTHPSESGRLKVAKLLLDFLVTDTTSKIWFLSTFSYVPENKAHQILTITPNPASDYIEIKVDNESPNKAKNSIRIYNTLGKCVIYIDAIHELPLQRIDISHLPAGVYFLQIGNQTKMFIKIK